MEKKHISIYWTCVICSQGQQIAFFCRSSESWDSKAGSSPSILENVVVQKEQVFRGEPQEALEARKVSQSPLNLSFFLLLLLLRLTI